VRRYKHFSLHGVQGKKEKKEKVTATSTARYVAGDESISLSLCRTSSPIYATKRKVKPTETTRLIEMRNEEKKNGTESDGERNDRATRDVSF